METRVQFPEGKLGGAARAAHFPASGSRFERFLARFVDHIDCWTTLTIAKRSRNSHVGDKVLLPEELIELGLNYKRIEGEGAVSGMLRRQGGERAFRQEREQGEVGDGQYRVRREDAADVSLLLTPSLP